MRGTTPITSTNANTPADTPAPAKNAMTDKNISRNIFKQHYMIQKEGQYKGYPLRTYVGNNFQGGFSDHFPVYIYISK